MSAWVYQDDKQVKKVGAAAASWYVGWIDPDGKRRCKSCGPGKDGKRSVEKLRRKTEAELLTGTYQSNSRKTWADFRKEYEAKIADGMGPGTRRLVLEAMNTFERIINPKRMAGIKTQTIDAFRAKRRTELVLPTPLAACHNGQHVRKCQAGLPPVAANGVQFLMTTEGALRAIADR
jgi:hypothetical protein